MSVIKRQVDAKLFGGSVRLKTDLFFDRNRVVNAVGLAAAKSLSRGGAYVRRRARSLVRYRKRASAPGKPPSAHGNWSPLRELIHFNYDPATKSVVVGPAIFGTQGGRVPGVLERGGLAPGRRNPRRTTRILGGSGEIRIGGRSCANTKPAKTYRDQTVEVTYAHLTTEAQVTRANQLNEELYGPAQLPAAAIEPRPFMLPSLEATQEQLPELWKNSLVAN